MVRAFVYVAIGFFVVGCSVKNATIETKQSLVKSKHEILKKKHLDLINQDVDSYLDALENQQDLFSQEDFERQYFYAWNMENGNEFWEDIDWAFQSYMDKKAYGQNLKLLNSSFFDKAYNNANYFQFNTVNKKAITLKSLDIRAFPTDKPLFLDPQKAGEGYPFDYLQNSRIHANKPLLVTHFSTDKKWAHIISSFTFGWVHVKDIVFLNEVQTQQYQHAKQAFIIKDNIPLYSKQGEFLLQARLGMILPIIKENQNSLEVLVVSSYKTDEPRFMRANISKEIAHIGSIDFTKERMKPILNDILKSKYGWGGLLAERDCSSTIRDMFTPFGLWLPRNSSKQSQVGQVISLENLNKDEKIALIKEKAIPFRTLLYKKGHIVLYVGVQNGEVIILQNVWGVKTKKDNKEDRYIVGRVVFSTLELGKELKFYDDEASLLNNLSSMNIF